jgi:uncharacterized OsmC-like protein
MTAAIAAAIQKTRQMLESAPKPGPSSDRSATAEVEEGLRCRVESDGWSLVTDMPAAVGGSGSAPTAGWVLRAAWAACDATAIAMRAAEVGIRLTHLQVVVESESDFRGVLGVGDVPPGPASARILVRIAADGVEPTRLREIVHWAERHSPVGDALRRAIPVEVEVEPS